MRRLVLFVLTGLLLGCGGWRLLAVAAQAEPAPAAGGPFDIVMAGLRKPRGLVFGPDGSLYVADAGFGGPQLVDLGRIRPHTVGRSGRLWCLRPDGTQEIVVDGLPSTVTAYHEPVGPAALALLDGQIYLLTASGGWDVGETDFHNGIFRLREDASLERIFDYSAYLLAHPTQARREDPRADVPLGMPFGLTALDGQLYVTDANQEQILAVSPLGEARQLAEYPKSDRALTGLAAGPDRALYVAEYAASTLTRVTLAGEVSDVAVEVPVPIGVAFDSTGRVYVLEYRLGRLVRAQLGDLPNWETLVDGLAEPTGLTIGPDGSLYLSVGGGKANNPATVVRVRVGSPGS